MSVRILTDTLGRRYVSRKKVRAPCLQCGEQTRRRGSAVAQYCSHKCYWESKKGDFPQRQSPPNLQVALSCKHCGKEFKRRRGHVNDSGANYCSRDCSNIANLDKVRATLANAPSSLERALYAHLDRAGVMYIPQHRIGRFIVDAYIPEAKLAIEVDGEYWHSLPANKERDSRKDAAMAERGIRVARIPERVAKVRIADALREVGACP